MSLIEATCCRCHQPFTPDRETILRGTWRTCPACRPAVSSRDAGGDGAHCRECGRPLRAGKRDICASCLGVLL